ncbi:hypothetical protein ACVV4A_04125 [Escherichia coli]
MIAKIIQVAEQEQNKNKGIFVPACAGRGTSFLGLYRNRVGDKSGMKDCFKANIFAAHLFRGISSFSDVFFFIKLLGKLF